MAETDLPIICIRNFLGHASIKSTEIYTIHDRDQNAAKNIKAEGMRIAFA